MTNTCTKCPSCGTTGLRLEMVYSKSKQSSMNVLHCDKCKRNFTIMAGNYFYDGDA